MSGHGDHSDLWNYYDGLREDLGRAEERIRELENRCAALEKQTPAAQRLQYEADVAGADAAEYDRHGRDCGCAYCATGDDEEPEEYDPGPEVDDEGGMSEYRFSVPLEEV